MKEPVFKRDTPEEILELKGFHRQTESVWVNERYAAHIQSDGSIKYLERKASGFSRKLELPNAGIA